MDYASVLPLLQAFMLVTDGVGIFASYTIAQYYRSGSEDLGIYLLYMFFIILFLVFIALSVSDAMVIMKFSNTWATIPIVRGLVFRAPLTFIELWIIHKQHAD